MGDSWQLESHLFLEHKGNVFRPFLPPAILRNRPCRGEEPHTRHAEERPFLLPQDTAEMLCHPQVDTCILPVTFTFLSRNFASFFPLPEITACFPSGQAMPVVPCCLWAAPVPVLLPVQGSELCDPTWAVAGLDFLPHPVPPLGRSPAEPRGFPCPSCVKAVLDTSQRGEETVQFDIVTHPDTPLRGFVAL